MSKQNLERALRRELDVLNYQIDHKIIRGLSYAKEARRHKYVVSSLNRLRKVNRSAWFMRPLNMFNLA